MNIYKTSCVEVLFSLLHTLKYVIVRYLYFDKLVHNSGFFILFFKNISKKYYVFYNGISSRVLHPPNKPHPAKLNIFYDEYLFPKIVFKIFKTP